MKTALEEKKKKGKKVINGRVVHNWLTDQLAYTLHKPAKKKYVTRRYKTSGINDLWQMDLMEMIPYSKINKGYKYILTCIDVFSRMARAQPLKNKTGIEVSRAIEKMLSKSSTSMSPTHIQTDMGKEFYNSHVKMIFKKYSINHYSVYSQFKAAYVERFNRTLRERLNRYFTHTGKKVWHNVLSTIIDTYNKTKHKGLYNNLSPLQVTKENEHIQWLHQQKQDGEERIRKSNHIKLFDYVRVSHAKGPFLKNFDQNWSDEVFQVVAIDTKDKPVMYIIKDTLDQVISGKFYGEELQTLGDKPPQVYRIERVIKSKGKDKDKQYYVKWVGYSSQHNSWVDANDINKSTATTTTT